MRYSDKSSSANSGDFRTSETPVTRLYICKDAPKIFVLGLALHTTLPSQQTATLDLDQNAPHPTNKHITQQHANLPSTCSIRRRRPTGHVIVVRAGATRATSLFRRDRWISHLLLNLCELVLELPDSEIREMLLRHLPSVLSYLLVELALNSKERENVPGGYLRSWIGFRTTKVF